MFLLILIIFSVTFFSIRVNAENSEPFCKLQNDSSNTVPEYQCFNYKSLPTNLTNPEEIKKIHLNGDSNNLQILKNGDLFASKTTNLKGLFLIRCKIKEIEKGAFRGGYKITEMALTQNQIEKLDLNVFEDLPNLEKLWLNDNPLSFLYNSFPRSNLTLLHLADCRLRSINPNIFENLVNLNIVHIYGNLLSTLDWKLFHPLKKLQNVYFFKNPFHCDCKIKFLLDYLDKRNIQWKWQQKPSCSFSSFDGYVDIPTAKKLKEQLILVNWDVINRQYLVCPPQIAILEKSEDTKNISIKCKYSGYPEPSITWRIDGEIVQIDNRNKYLIETRPAGEINGDYNYEFVQTLFISYLPFSTPRSESQVTCQASSLVFESTKSNAITVNFQNNETATITTSNLASIGTGNVPTNKEHSNQVILIIAAVILVAAIFFAILCRKHTPCSHIRVWGDPRIPVEDNPAGQDHIYDYIGPRWIQDEDGYETPPSISIQRLRLPPLPKQQDPRVETNN